MNISISLCPTSLQFDNGDTYDQDKLLAALRQYIEETYPGATISCLQVGHSQGDEWAKVDGDDDEGLELVESFFAEHGTDEDLFEEPQGISAAAAFDLTVVGRARYGSSEWVVFDDGSYRHVVEAGHFDDCGAVEREPDDETRCNNYTAWCRRGLWADDDVAAKVAALCGLTHVHSATDGGCGRVAAAEAQK